MLLSLSLSLSVSLTRSLKSRLSTLSQVGLGWLDGPAGVQSPKPPPKKPSNAGS